MDSDSRFIRYISKSRFKNLSVEENKIECENAFAIISNSRIQPRPNGKLYHVVISNTKTTNVKELNFLLTNRFFNRIHREIRHTPLYINYLFILEYPKAVSVLVKRITTADLHIHITINTNISYFQLGRIFDTMLRKDLHFYIEDISVRLDKFGLINYLTKQSLKNRFLTHDHFGYKIDYKTYL